MYLQFFLIKGFEQVLRYNLIEAFLQGQKLSLNAMQEAPVHIQPAENMREEGRGGDRRSLSFYNLMNFKYRFIDVILDNDYTLVQDAAETSCENSENVRVLILNFPVGCSCRFHT